MDMGVKNPAKLADVLKRSGLAASINDAKRIASDISSTESKVQRYFDQKKVEMQDDLANRSRNTYVERPISMGKHNHTESQVRMHLENNNMLPKIEEKKHEAKGEKRICPHCKKESYHDPVLKDLSAVEKEVEKHVSLQDMFKEEEQGQEYIYSRLSEGSRVPNAEQSRMVSFGNETIMKPIETKIETVETIIKPIETKIEVIEEKPTKPLMENRIEIIEETPSEPKYNENGITLIPNEPIPKEKQMDVSEEKKIDLTQMFNFGARTQAAAPKQEIKAEQKPVEVKSNLGITTSSASSHPKTGNSVSIDINEMFNFSKRGRM